MIRSLESVKRLLVESEAESPVEVCDRNFPEAEQRFFLAVDWFPYLKRGKFAINKLLLLLLFTRKVVADLWVGLVMGRSIELDKFQGL